MLWSQLLFQDPSSDLMSTLVDFHNSTMITINMILAYVVASAFSFLSSEGPSISPHIENHELEVGWTLLPGVTLLLLALPSLRLLYLMEESIQADLVIKITGNQWYWSYDYASIDDFEFDSFMSPSESLEPGDLRLLEVDNRMVIPYDQEARLLLTSADVLHAWTIPSMGVKADAVPGRLNQMSITPKKLGVYYGQCSEICGANHSFMPISVEVIPNSEWNWWLSGMIWVEIEFG